jgi:hypothetical protein
MENRVFRVYIGIILLAFSRTTGQQLTEYTMWEDLADGYCRD